MTQNERAAITAAKEALKNGFDINTMKYDESCVMEAHRILNGMDLAPRKSATSDEQASLV